MAYFIRDGFSSDTMTTVDIGGSGERSIREVSEHIMSDDEHVLAFIDRFINVSIVMRNEILVRL